jgi:hemerythrin superfamily protein
MKATALLEMQRVEVEGIFEKLESGNGDAATLRSELANKLAAHMTTEHEIFYPAIRTFAPALVAESFEEHAVIELALKRLLHTSPSSTCFRARVGTLKDLLRHHVAEEEDDLFPAVEKHVGEDELHVLGACLKRAYDDALERGVDALVPESMSTTSADLANRPTARSRQLVA